MEVEAWSGKQTSCIDTRTSMVKCSHQSVHPMLTFKHHHQAQSIVVAWQVLYKSRKENGRPPAAAPTPPTLKTTRQTKDRPPSPATCKLAYTRAKPQTRHYSGLTQSPHANDTALTPPTTTHETEAPPPTQRTHKKMQPPLRSVSRITPETCHLSQIEYPLVIAANPKTTRKTAARVTPHGQYALG